MPPQYKDIGLDEFVRKVIERKRNLTYIRLPKGSDLAAHSRYREMQDFLKAHNHQEKPFDLSNSILTGIIAPSLYLPFLIAQKINLKEANINGADFRGAKLESAYLRRAYLREANLRGADLEGANFGGADLNGAKLERAILWRVNLIGANLKEASLRGADLIGADLREANLERADLREADLRGVTNLEHAISLDEGSFENTIVTKKEKAIIEAAMPTKRNLFVVKPLDKE